ncbi:hypothetical protein BDW75DRAFT_20044 [Aspergillus navahoensis]
MAQKNIPCNVRNVVSQLVSEWDVQCSKTGGENTLSASVGRTRRTVPNPSVNRPAWTIVIARGSSWPGPGLLLLVPVSTTEQVIWDAIILRLEISIAIRSSPLCSMVLTSNGSIIRIPHLKAMPPARKGSRIRGAVDQTRSSSQSYERDLSERESFRRRDAEAPVTDYTRHPAIISFVAKQLLSHGLADCSISIAIPGSGGSAVQTRLFCGDGDHDGLM